MNFLSQRLTTNTVEKENRTEIFRMKNILFVLFDVIKTHFQKEKREEGIIIIKF